MARAYSSSRLALCGSLSEPQLFYHVSFWSARLYCPKSMLPWRIHLLDRLDGGLSPTFCSSSHKSLGKLLQPYTIAFSCAATDPQRATPPAKASSPSSPSSSRTGHIRTTQRIAARPTAVDNIYDPSISADSDHKPTRACADPRDLHQ